MFLTRAVFVLAPILTGVICISNRMKVIAPKAVISGSNITLWCSYDLEGEPLYSVKWYRQDVEFYKFTPREDPSKKRFNVHGLNVLMDSSNETHVTLTRVAHENGGVFACEVTADAPSFYTNVERATVQVVDLPSHGPQITNMKSKYRPGELLKAECVTRGSRPAANLTWLINGQPVDPVHIRHNRIYQLQTGLTVQSGLRMHITQEMLSEGRFSVSCTAAIYDVYAQTCERQVEFSRKTPTTTTQASNNLYYALPAARHPETTLIFTIEDEHGGGGSRRKPESLLLNFTACALFLFVYTLCTV